MKVGVLALQGAFAKHIQMLDRCGVEGFEVRKPEELLLCDALIIPGGESTTIQHQLSFITMEIKKFDKPILGTCAGAILLANEQLIDMDIERNGYGRQVDSFISTLDQGNRGVFIRAPRIKRLGRGVEVLGTLKGEPVYVRQGNRVATTFHPELTDDYSIHLEFVRETGVQSSS